jgi:hypothetical protein
VGRDAVIQADAKLAAPGGQIVDAAVSTPQEFPVNGPLPDRIEGGGPISVMDSSIDSTPTERGQPAGSVFIRGGRLQVIASPTGVSKVMSETLDGDRPGTVDVSGSDLRLSGGSFAYLSVDNSAPEGHSVDGEPVRPRLRLNADHIALDGTSVFAGTTAGAAGADVTIAGGRVELTADARLIADTFGSGLAGNISITAEELTVGQGAAIRAVAVENSTAPPADRVGCRETRISGREASDAGRSGLRYRGAIVVHGATVMAPSEDV